MSSGPTTGDLPSIDEVLADSAASCWLKTALRSALRRDPVDAANERRSWHDCWKIGATKSCPSPEHIEAQLAFEGSTTDF